MKRTGLCLSTLACWSLAFAGPPVSPPSWLLPYPGAKEEGRVQSEARAEVTFVASAKPEDVLEHYRKLFAEQSLPFVPNFDGLGTTLRGSRDGSLLISIRGNGDQTNIRIVCVARTGKAADSSAPVNSSPTKSTPARPGRGESPSQHQDEVTRQVLAQEEDAHKKRMQRMSEFDQPVKVRSKKNEPASSGTRKD